MSKSEKRLRRRLADFAAQANSLAECLESEIKHGICIRQSLECKQARADILRLLSSQIRNLLNEIL